MSDNSAASEIEWKRVHGGGWRILIGLVLLAFSLFVMGSSLGWAEFRDSNGESIPWFFGIPIGTLLAALGLAFVFGRGGFEINKQRGTIRCWWGWVVPLDTAEYRLQDYTNVVLSKESHRGGTSYTVRLTGGATEIPVETKSEYDDAWRLAEELAAFCQVDLVDCSSTRTTKNIRPEKPPD